jgi:hypothetical protein
LLQGNKWPVQQLQKCKFRALSAKRHYGKKSKKENFVIAPKNAVLTGKLLLRIYLSSDRVNASPSAQARLSNAFKWRATNFCRRSF